jgi:hypothetical protein
MHNIRKSFMLIGWLVDTSFEQFMLFLATGDYAWRREPYQFEAISHRDYSCGRDFQTNSYFYEEQLLNMKPPMFKATRKSISIRFKGDSNFTQFQYLC